MKSDDRIKKTFQTFFCFLEVPFNGLIMGRKIISERMWLGMKHWTISQGFLPPSVELPLWIGIDGIVFGASWDRGVSCVRLYTTPSVLFLRSPGDHIKKILMSLFKILMSCSHERNSWERFLVFFSFSFCFKLTYSEKFSFPFTQQRRKYPSFFFFSHNPEKSGHWQNSLKISVI